MAVSQSMLGSRAFRVLLVEDNPAEAELVFERLSGSGPGGFDITHVLDMKRATAACNTGSFDCVVLDLQLPDTRGVETIRSMRARCPDAPIIAYSGLDDDAARAASLREGAQDFISKNGAEAGSLDRSILFALERWRALKQHKQLQMVFAANPDAIIVCSPAGLVRFANPAAMALFDLAAGLVPEPLASAVQQGRDIADLAIGSGAHTRSCQIRLAECTWEGEASILASIRDVTDAKALSERVRKLNKMQLVGRFAGGLAHDFGNILACIDMVAEAAQRDVEGEPAISSQLSKIRSSTESGRAIVRQLLSLERSQVKSPEVVVLQSLLAEVEALLRQVLPEEIEFAVSVAADTPRVMIDRSHIEQVLLNLAFNARDAMAGGGSLRIVCQRLLGDGHQASILVSDSGCGIAAEDLGRVFDLFFTTKAPGRGSGLGLAMCQAMIEQANGTISVKSRVGEGATFQILLPGAPLDQKEAARPAAHPA